MENGVDLLYVLYSGTQFAQWAKWMQWVSHSRTRYCVLYFVCWVFSFFSVSLFFFPNRAIQSWICQYALNVQSHSEVCLWTLQWCFAFLWDLLWEGNRETWTKILCGCLIIFLPLKKKKKRVFVRQGHLHYIVYSVSTVHGSILILAGSMGYGVPI